MSITLFLQTVCSTCHWRVLPVRSFLNRVLITVPCSFTRSHFLTISPADTKCSTSRSAITCNLENATIWEKQKIKNWDSRRMEHNSIYDWSTHLLELSFMPTSAYKTSTIAGSSFIYSMPFISTCRGFPSVMSLMGDNRKVQGQFYHIVTIWSSLILMLFFFFFNVLLYKEHIVSPCLLQTLTAEAGAHMAEKKWGMLGVLKECVVNLCIQSLQRGIINFKNNKDPQQTF